MRVLIAGLLGGIVVFFWGFIAHTVLPIGEFGVKLGTPHEAVLAALKANTDGEGIYILPSLPNEQMNDSEAMKAMAPTWAENPYALIVYQPQGQDMGDMAAELPTEFVTNVLSAWLVAWMLAAGAFGFGRRLLMSTGLGVFAWLAISVPQWNWYRFPLDFTLSALVQHGVGWFLAGLVMAWWLGRKGG